MASRSPPHFPPDIAELAKTAPVALFLDFDGTLVEIAKNPGAIDVPPDLGARLEMLAGRHGGRLALVSGRSCDDLAHHIGEVAIALSGSHGADCRLADGRAIGAPPRALPEELVEELGRFAKNARGVELERKPHGAALHYRSAPELETQVRAFAEAVAGEFALKTKCGKCVVEIVRPDADKSIAVEVLMGHAPFAGSVPVFVGDDVTDEDGFRAAAGLGGFGVRVGERADSAAQYQLSDTRDVYAWLNL